MSGWKDRKSASRVAALVRFLADSVDHTPPHSAFTPTNGNEISAATGKSSPTYENERSPVDVTKLSNKNGQVVSENDEGHYTRRISLINNEEDFVKNNCEFNNNDLFIKDEYFTEDETESSNVEKARRPITDVAMSSDVGRNKFEDYKKCGLPVISKVKYGHGKFTQLESIFKNEINLSSRKNYMIREDSCVNDENDESHGTSCSKFAMKNHNDSRDIANMQGSNADEKKAGAEDELLVICSSSGKTNAISDYGNSQTASKQQMNVSSSHSPDSDTKSERGFSPPSCNHVSGTPNGSLKRQHQGDSTSEVGIYVR